MLDLIDEHQIACEKLTRDQLAKCVLQAIVCGDFIKQVAVSHGSLKAGPQAVFYVPYADMETLRSRITKLESVIIDAGLELP